MNWRTVKDYQTELKEMYERDDLTDEQKSILEKLDGYVNEIISVTTSSAPNVRK